MKRISTYLLMIISSLLVACSQKETLPQYPGITFDFSVSDIDLQSRAIKDGWTEGDILYLWFNPITQADPDLTLTYGGSGWKAGVLREGCSLDAEGSFHVLYDGKDGLRASGSYYRGGIQYKNPSESILSDGKTGTYAYASDLQTYCANVSYKFSDNCLTASIKGWKLLTDFQVTLTGVYSGEYALLCKSKESFIVVDEGFMMTSDGGGSVSVSGQNASYYASGIAKNGEVVFYYTHVNGNEVTSPITFTLIPKIDGVYDEAHALNYSPGEKTLKAGGSLQAVIIPYTKFVRTPEAVDMGLSVKWSTLGLGAASESDFGYYYAFGETEPKSNYYWTNYLHCLGTIYSFTKYCPKDQSKYWGGEGDPDGKTVLDLSDDVANVKLGGKWRIPTGAEWSELLNKDKCTWKWTSRNGLYGYEVKSKITGNSIFLPAAGYQHGENPSSYGSFGYYWSASLDTDAPYNALFLNFGSTYFNMTSDSGLRYLGYSIRPVLGK